MSEDEWYFDDAILGAVRKEMYRRAADCSPELLAHGIYADAGDALSAVLDYWSEDQ